MENEFERLDNYLSKLASPPNQGFLERLRERLESRKSRGAVITRRHWDWFGWRVSRWRALALGMVFLFFVSATAVAAYRPAMSLFQGFIGEIVLENIEIVVGPPEYLQSKVPGPLPTPIPESSRPPNPKPTIAYRVEDAQQLVDFPIRLPGWLPPGKELTGIAAFPEGEYPSARKMVWLFYSVSPDGVFEKPPDQYANTCCVIFQGYSTMKTVLLWDSRLFRYEIREIQLPSGQTAVWAEDPIYSLHWLMWEDGGYVFKIEGNISLEDAIKIAESF